MQDELFAMSVDAYVVTRFRYESASSSKTGKVPIGLTPTPRARSERTSFHIIARVAVATVGEILQGFLRDVGIDRCTRRGLRELY